MIYVGLTYALQNMAKYYIDKFMQDVGNQEYMERCNLLDTTMEFDINVDNKWLNKLYLNKILVKQIYARDLFFDVIFVMSPNILGKSRNLIESIYSWIYCNYIFDKVNDNIEIRKSDLCFQDGVELHYTKFGKTAITDYFYNLFQCEYPLDFDKIKFRKEDKERRLCMSLDRFLSLYTKIKEKNLSSLYLICVRINCWEDLVKLITLNLDIHVIAEIHNYKAYGKEHFDYMYGNIDKLQYLHFYFVHGIQDFRGYQIMYITPCIEEHIDVFFTPLYYAELKGKLLIN